MLQKQNYVRHMIFQVASSAFPEFVILLMNCGTPEWGFNPIFKNSMIIYHTQIPSTSTHRVHSGIKLLIISCAITHNFHKIYLQINKVFQFYQVDASSKIHKNLSLFLQKILTIISIQIDLWICMYQKQCRFYLKNNFFFSQNYMNF